MSTYVDEQKQFSSLCKQLKGTATLAVDTEFVGEYSYYPKLALIQIAAEGEVWIIDPLAIKDLGDLGRILSNEKTTVIVHNGETDLAILDRACKAKAPNLFDTQIAAAFLGMAEQIGLLTLVGRTVGKKLGKGQQVTDWLKRPLTDEQLTYAAADVAYLEAIYKNLFGKLKQSGRLPYFQEELEIKRQRWLSPVDIDSRFKSTLKSARTKRQLESRRRLLQWRENTATRHDKPRRHVLSDEGVMAVAAQLPKNSMELKSLRLVSDRAAKRYGDELIALCEKLSKISEERISQPKQRNQGYSRSRSRIPLVKMAMTALAEEAGIAHGLIARSSEIEELCRAASNSGKRPDLPCMQGWRGRLVGNKLWRFARGEATLRIGTRSDGPSIILKEIKESSR